MGDRLRAAAFAELQAREAFRWAAERYADAPEGLPQAWRSLAEAEDRHLEMLLERMAQLGVDVKGRTVSSRLWTSLVNCATAKEFAVFMAEAEERGRRAGLRFLEQLGLSDPKSAEVFGRIATEEWGHIELARRYFPASSNGKS